MIKREILDFYQRLYSEAEEWRSEFTFRDCAKLSEEEKLWLQRSFDEQEVLEGVKACASDKAPRPGG